MKVEYPVVVRALEDALQTRGHLQHFWLSRNEPNTRRQLTTPYDILPSDRVFIPLRRVYEGQQPNETKPAIIKRLQIDPKDQHRKHTAIKNI